MRAVYVCMWGEVLPTGKHVSLSLSLSLCNAHHTCVCMVYVGEVLPTGKHVSGVFASLSSPAAMGSEDTVYLKGSLILKLSLHLILYFGYLEGQHLGMKGHSLFTVILGLDF